MPVSANVAGKDLVVNELRVKYLVLDSGGYSIIDRSNHIVDSGEYLDDDAASPQTMVNVGREGPNACRTMLAIYQLVADRLAGGGGRGGGGRPGGGRPRGDRRRRS